MLRAAPLLSLLALALAGCLPNDKFPDGGIPPPPRSCGNGTCEPPEESNVNCVKDCPNCYAILAVSSQGGSAAAAVGKEGDGKAVDIGENGTLDLTIGWPIRHTGKADVKLYGTVTGSAAPPPTDPQTGCPTKATVSGAVKVDAAGESRQFQTIGFWTQGGPAEFSLGCGVLSDARYLLLTALAGAKFSLDAVQASSCGPI